MENKILMADKVFKNPQSIDSGFLCGFNQRVQGDLDIHGRQYYDYGTRVQGFNKAEDLINEGKIYYTHIFPHRSYPEGPICKGHAFYYGGSVVCNSCGRSGLCKDWWNIKFMKDGDAWIVMGEGFENLQESNNYAFGDTKEQAFQNYQELMENITPPPIAATETRIQGE